MRKFVRNIEFWAPTLILLNQKLHLNENHVLKSLRCTAWNAGTMRLPFTKTGFIHNRRDG